MENAEAHLNYGGGDLKYLQSNKHHLKPAVLMLSVLAILFLISVRSTPVLASAITENNNAAKSLMNQEYAPALDSLSRALTQSPFSPEIHYNLGLTWMGLGQVESGTKSYKSAIEMSKNPEVQFRSLFNLGELAGKEKKIDEALMWYQKALDVRPDSIEVKTNIELLIQNQKSGGGQGGNKDQKDQQKKDQNKDQKDQDKGEGDPKEKDQGQQDNRERTNKPRPQPKPFKSDQLTQSDVNKILGELKQQEQKIRAEFNKREIKEQPRDKDW